MYFKKYSIFVWQPNNVYAAQPEPMLRRLAGSLLEVIKYRNLFANIFYYSLLSLRNVALHFKLNSRVLRLTRQYARNRCEMRVENSAELKMRIQWKHSTDENGFLSHLARAHYLLPRKAHINTHEMIPSSTNDRFCFNFISATIIRDRVRVTNKI